MDNSFLDIAVRFRTDSEPLFCKPYGNGHINSTFLVGCTSGGRYILQRINRYVFKQPEALMRNALAVTGYLRKNAGTGEIVLEFIATHAGERNADAEQSKLTGTQQEPHIDTATFEVGGLKPEAYWLTDSEGELWRMYRIVDGVSFERADAATFKESGVAFGSFQRRLAGFPAEKLHETIPHFHDTPSRYRDFHAALDRDEFNRAKDVRAEIDFALEREDYSSRLTDMLASGELPLRVTHNDTKLNNVIFDKDTGKALCVIDLDTVMPGLSVYDFGDSIRFGASTAEEDERDISKVCFSLPLFSAFTEGFLSERGEILTAAAKECLIDGAKMLTLETGVRFLTDHLSGDIYFKTKRDGHNLDRCRTQFKLVSDMEQQWSQMRATVRSFDSGR